MTTTSDLSWVKVLSRGLSKKVTNAQPQRAKDDQFKLIPEVLYEHKDLKAEVLTRKATAILQQDLTPGSVLFTFPSKTFEHRTAAYRLIKEQISPLAQFRPLSLYHQKANGDLLLEAKFDNFEAAKLAISHGITHREVVYKATAAKDNNEGKLTRVQMTIVRMPDMTTFLEDLQRSLKYYGKVYQIKKYTVDGFFEDLSRMMYLSAWDIYVPATFREAPPVCHFCRQSGHIRDSCPVLVKRQCFKCRKPGHTAKFCCEEEPTFTEALDEYVAIQKDRADSTVDNQRSTVKAPERRRRTKAAIPTQPASQSTEVTDSQIINLSKNFDSSSQEQDVDQMEIDPKTIQRTSNGSDASKHAPLASSLHMHVDYQQPTAIASSSNDFTSDVLPLRRHSMSSASMSQTPVYHVAHRA
ncbi:uncharacterized protein ATC70_009486 [Mucor velutinosus]|uniref:CCHC-type domain-containing protein n=1 Tax=Mucor velutinosus TaxID=708070 RepID=A0AAN7DMC9_9FUNG|nr:hypothetical protein ATC70_009486 [Mucor velutinosus]